MLKEYVQAALAKLTAGENSIVALKGIPLDFADDNAVENIEVAAKNPLKYFNAVVNSGRKIFAFEEFLLLKDFLSAQFDEIFILNNNLYIAQYPIEIRFSDGTLDNLLGHFREPEIERGIDFNPGKLEKIFTGLKSHNSILVGVYNDETAAENFSVQFVDLFDAADNFSLITGVAQDFFELNDESDFVCLVRKIIFDAPPEIYISLQNYLGDKAELKAHLKILCKNFSVQTKIYLVPREEIYAPFHSKPENLAFLKKIWGYNSFRTLTVYDLRNLSAATKPMQKISQEQIIADILAQVELCRLGKKHRDIFVTAPTGAGKSLIFQFPALWFAEKFRLFTIVISPLIGLMDDQVKNLQKVYPAVETFHSGTPPLIRQQIVQKISEGRINILYVSPETLLSRSDIEQLIGTRTLGLIVIDEAHIVTTWGKQFRPDYWYLGDHIRRLQKNQREQKGHAFVIATFTATMIFQGFENMYEETVDSLNLQNPLRYFGEIKRDDIEIEIDRSPISSGQRALHDILKFDDLQSTVVRANAFKRKTLIYFPEVRLIDKALIALQNENLTSGVTIYHGQLDKNERIKNQREFGSGKKFVMLATKAFGMGIDIDDIEIVLHYAPTGNVCDYVQEIGRAARRNNLQGKACYHYSPNDFKYINRLHGLSTIKLYQLFEVIRKLCEIYRQNRAKNPSSKSSLLLSAENFTYIFDRYGDENSSVNKVKTALLIIQRNFERRLGFSPIHVRPIPLYAYGYFEISPRTQTRLKNQFGDCLSHSAKNICLVNLKRIWQQAYQEFSFPQFKYRLYDQNKDLDFNKLYNLRPVLKVSINFKPNFQGLYRARIAVFKNLVDASSSGSKYVTAEDVAAEFVNRLEIADYAAQNISEILIASVEAYAENFVTGFRALFAKNFRPNSRTDYRFNSGMNQYFAWLDKIFRDIVANTDDGCLYLKNLQGKDAKAHTIVLGILEALSVISFEMTGGEDTQLYIHITQIENLQNILNNRSKYRNHILEDVADRHRLSVEMLSYIYKNDFTSTQIWNLLEDYFFGKIPSPVRAAYNSDEKHHTDI